MLDLSSAWVGDHPRVCGEHRARRSAAPTNTGSSPRMRGALVVPPPCDHPQRDHPRVCGEHSTRAASPLAAGGSSPRMRGAPSRLHRRGRVPGIIPAYAGSTSYAKMAWRSSRDHPRVCGEHQGSAPPSSSARGSSPRMRGAPRAHPRRLRGDGIIPAYAGSTHTRPRIDVPHGDHPRVCGEHLVAVVLLVLPVGSSPRMRGAPRAGAPAANTGGIIPAYAGSTGQRVAKNAPRRDHPRVCGEHPANRTSKESFEGSSPRMRGAPGGRGGVLRGDGIIPAYAGSTVFPILSVKSDGDHPRVCGEHTSV